MHWFVYRENINARTIETFDIFQHYSFHQDVQKLIQRTRKLSKAERFTFKEEFGNQLRSLLMYYFWCKCEYEILIFPSFGSQGAKVDIFSQVIMNWDHFLSYVWNTAQERHTSNICPSSK